VRFTQQGKSDARNRVSTLFRDYRHTVHPCPFKFEDFYWFAWERDEQAALKLLHKKRPESINSGSYVTINCESIEGKRDYLKQGCKGVFRHPDGYNGWDYPDVEIKDEEITNLTLRNRLLKWTVRAKQLKDLQSKCEMYFRRHLHDSYVSPGQPGTLNTPGQLYRVWPELACLIEYKYRDRVANQKLKSSLPELWDDDYVALLQGLDGRKEIDTILLAITVMEDDLKMDGDFPSI
jgi:hypothetical protein